MQQQQQKHLKMQPMMAAYYPNNVTTDHIQQYLDENKSLILKIVESQNSGKPNEFTENHARLQRNLMYLSAIANSHSQTQPSSMLSQFLPGGIFQHGVYYAATMNPQPLMDARSSMLYSQQQLSALHQQQALHSQQGRSSVGNSGLHMLPTESNSSRFPNFCQGGESRGIAGRMKLDIGSAEWKKEFEAAEARYMKAGEDGN